MPERSLDPEPLVRALVEANRAWARHISIVGANGIQMLTARNS